jgi:single-strand DNA-binding protein
MAGFNHCVFVGRVGRTPEERTINEGVKVCHFSLAIDEGKDKDPLWFTIVAWRKLAEQVKSYVKKGDPVLVAGKLSVRKYTDKQSVERTAVEVVAQEIRFLSAKPATKAEEPPPPTEPDGQAA